MGTRIFLIMCVLYLGESNNIAAQSTSNKKISNSADAELEFILIPFFPSVSDSASQTVADLSHALLYHAYSDTIWNKKLKWLKPDQIRRSFTCATDEGTFVSYIVLGKVAADRFVVLACMNMRGPVQTYTFVINRKDNKLIKTGGKRMDNITDYPVSLDGSKLIWHDDTYLIPASE
jgi:hypothetical protein